MMAKASAQGSCGNPFSSGQSSSTSEIPPRREALLLLILHLSVSLPPEHGAGMPCLLCKQVLAGSATGSNSVSAGCSSFHALSVLEGAAAVAV